MRITELLEGKKFNDLDFVKVSGDKRELDFDLVEDLIHFMNEDDDVYRRHLYPVIADCINKVSAKRTPSSSIFKPVVEKTYEIYSKKFPIRELPNQLDTKMCEEVCDKLREEIIQHISDGKYKD